MATVEESENFLETTTHPTQIPKGTHNCTLVSNRKLANLAKTLSTLFSLGTPMYSEDHSLNYKVKL